MDKNLKTASKNREMEKSKRESKKKTYKINFVCQIYFFDF